MAAGDDDTFAYEIVFAVEATSNMVNHWESVKKQYICPIIQHFHKSSVSGNELLTNSFRNLYGLVLFYAADRTPDMLTECFSPYGNRWQFIKHLESIEFNGGGAEHHSYIAEGLATVLQLFDDMKHQQRNKRVERFCFIISNTPPYDLPVIESYAYSGMTYQNLMDKLRERGIKLSIICPHLIKELKQLFLLANDNPSQLMNYAQDKRHLVLISGFHLSLEKEPWQLTDNATNDTITTIKTEIPMEVTPSNEDVIPLSIASNVTIKPEFPSSSPAQQPTTTSLFTNPTSTSNTPIPVPVSQTAFPNPSQPNQLVKAEPVMVTENRPIAPTANVPTRSTVSTVPCFPSSSDSLDSKPAAQYDSAMREAKNIIEIANSTTQKPVQNNAPNPPTTSPESNRSMIWSGLLEWSEKRKLPLPGGKIVQSVPCQIFQGASANQRDMINASNWPTKLTVQLIPQQVIAQSPPLHGYLKANKQVFLYFQPQDVARMAKLFSQRNVHGLIQHFSPNEDKLIFFFLKKRDDRPTFVGIIPDDPQGFISTLRQVIATKFSRQPPPNMRMPQQGDSNMQQNAAGQAMNQASSSIVPEPYTMNPNIQQFSGNQQRLPYPVQGISQCSSNKPQRISQPVSQPIRNISTINVPISQPPMNIRSQSGQTVMRPQLNNIRSGMAPSDNTGQQIRPNLAANMSGQRVIPSGMGIQNNPRAGLIRMQQINNMGGNMTGNRPISQGNSQLRNLLGPGNNSVMQTNNISMHQQDNSGLRPNAPNNMQQQNFTRGSNLMQGMQNQRNFGGLN